MIKYCVLAAAGNDNINNKVNDDSNGNNTTFTVKDTKLYVTVLILSARDNWKLLKLS